jgi:hypothetical protein
MTPNKTYYLQNLYLQQSRYFLSDQTDNGASSQAESDYRSYNNGKGNTEIQIFRFAPNRQEKPPHRITCTLHTIDVEEIKTACKPDLRLQNWRFSRVFSAGLSPGRGFARLPAKLLKLFVNRPFAECKNKQHNYTGYRHQHKQAQSPVVAGFREYPAKDDRFNDNDSRQYR